MKYLKLYETFEELSSNVNLNSFQKSMYLRIFKNYDKSVQSFINDNFDEYFNNLELFVSEGLITNNQNHILKISSNTNLPNFVLKDILSYNYIDDKNVFDVILSKIDGDMVYLCDESKNIIPQNKKAKIANNLISNLPNILTSNDEEISFSLEMEDSFFVTLNFSDEFFFSYKKNQESLFNLKNFEARVRTIIENPIRTITAAALVVGMSLSASAGEMSKTKYPNTSGYINDIKTNFGELSKKSPKGCKYSVEFEETVNYEKFLVNKIESLKKVSTINAKIKFVNYTVNLSYSKSHVGIKETVSKKLSIDQNDSVKKCGLSLKDEKEFSESVKKKINKALELDS